MEIYDKFENVELLGKLYRAHIQYKNNNKEEMAKIIEEYNLTALEVIELLRFIIQNKEREVRKYMFYD